MHLLVTRPQDKAAALLDAVTPWVESVHHQSVVEIKPGPDQHKVANTINNQPPQILIFVSGYAVDYFCQALQQPQLLQQSPCQLIAVGATTAAKLQTWQPKPVTSPTIETSEGLLQLPQLQQEKVKGQQIIIVRGVGGRELLAEQLRQRGAKVDYWQLYHRQPITDQGQQWFEQWQNWQINCISVTSIAIFDAIANSLPVQAKNWLQSIQWIVPSERVAAHVQSQGIKQQNIIDAKGANNQAILAQIKRLTEN